MDTCTPERMLSCLREPLLPPVTCTSAPHSWHTSPYTCISCSTPPNIQTCHTVGTAVGGGFQPPGPLLCPARGGAKSGPVGRSDLRPSLVTPPLGMTHCAPPKGRKPYITEALQGVVGVGSLIGPLVPPYDVPVDGLPGTSPLIMYLTQDIGCACVFSPHHI